MFRLDAAVSGNDTGEAPDEGAGAAGEEDSEARSEADEQGPDLEEGLEQLAAGLDEDPNAEKLLIIKEPRPGERDGAEEGGAPGAEVDWGGRTLDERLSAAGPAQQAQDADLGAGGDDRVAGEGGGPRWNPKGYDWLSDPCNVSWTEGSRLEGLCTEWYAKGDVGDGAAPVDPDDLDDWQRFAFDVATRERVSGEPPGNQGCV